MPNGKFRICGTLGPYQIHLFFDRKDAHRKLMQIGVIGSSRTLTGSRLVTKTFLATKCRFQCQFEFPSQFQFRLRLDGCTPD